MLWSLVVIVSITGVGGCVEQEQRSGQSFVEQIDSIVGKYVRHEEVGCMVAVIEDGQFAYKKSFGLADVEKKVAVTDETTFDLAEVSRHFTAANIGWLAANGAIQMDDDIRIYIPEMPRVDPPITIANLLYHTSGVVDYLEVMKKAGMESAADDLEIVDLLAEEKLEFAPGTRYSPNRSNYFLLAFLVQRVPSMSLAEWAQNVLLGPLEMRDSVFCDHPEKKPANKATGYVKAGERGFEKSANPNATIAGDTGFYTTVGDLLKWEKMLSEGEFMGEKFHSLMNATGQLTDGTKINYAAGMDVGSQGGLRVLSGSGSAVGFSAAMRRFPEKKLTVVCMSNYQGTDAAGLVAEVSRHCLASPEAAKSTAEEFVSIFDGKSFAGWEGNLDIFKIEDGAIVGGTLKQRIARNEFLCTAKEYDDFELRLKVNPTFSLEGVKGRL